MTQPTASQRAELVAAYQRSELLAGLPLQALQALASGARMRHFQAGEPLFWEGEPTLGMICLCSGQAKLFKLSPSGRELILRLVNPGEIFNEIPALDGGSNPVSAAGTQQGMMAVLPSVALRQILLQSPQNAEILIAHLAERMRYLVSMLEELSFYPLNHRLARLLCGMFEQTPPGQPLRITHKELASRLGTVREVVARGLRAMQLGGAIRVTRGRVYLLDERSLRVWCEPKDQHAKE